MDRAKVVRQFLKKTEGRGKFKRPRLRFLKDAESDLRKLKVKKWRQEASSREK
jgi:hypothetical protein